MRLPASGSGLEELAPVRRDIALRRAVVPRYPGPEHTVILDELIVDSPSGEKPAIADLALHRTRREPKLPERGESSSIVNAD